jgi:hypothetical protein
MTPTQPTDAATLLALAERVESAPLEMQGKLLEQAWELCAEYSAEFRAFTTSYLSGFDNNAGRFSMCLEASAYESAAMMLVPEGLAFEMTTTGYKPGATVCGNPMFDTHEGAYAATPALALVAAALRARAAMGEEN